MKANVEMFQGLAMRLYVQAERTNYMPTNATDAEAATHEEICRKNAQQALISAATFMQEFKCVEPMLQDLEPKPPIAGESRCVTCGGHRADGGPADPSLYPSDARLLCDECFDARETKANHDHRG